MKACVKEQGERSLTQESTQKQPLTGYCSPWRAVSMVLLD